MKHDDQTWRMLLDLNGPGLLIFARQFTSSLPDAEAIVQDGFVRCWRAHCDTVETSTVFLYSYVRRAALDYLRRERRIAKREQAAIERIPKTISFFEDPVERQELRESVEQAINTLPQEQREVVTLKCWSDLTFAEIATVLNVPQSTVSSRYAVALKKLRSLLASEVEE